jgi:hypothetical protein
MSKLNRTAVGLTRQSILFVKTLLFVKRRHRHGSAARTMDARAFAAPKGLRPRRRVKPADDGPLL